MATKKKPDDVDVADLQDQVADLQDGVADALEHLRSGRIERAVRSLEKVEPEEPAEDKD